MDKPIKRTTYLQPISREHHHGLLLCWKIKTGLAKGIPAVRIKTYADWFYQHHLLPHFDIEEKHIFPILGSDNTLVAQAIDEHRQLTKLFSGHLPLEDSLKQIQVLLDQHIRFEERTLFNEIEKVATEDQLKTIAGIHNEEEFEDNLADPFWKQI
jgi:hemerythrin-like domain-containing protein